MPSVILWFRHDLRLADHAALAAALATGASVIPVIIDDPAHPLGGAQRWWRARSLAALDQSLRERGSRLIIRRGGWAEQLARLRAETGAGLIFATLCHDPAARAAEDPIPDLRLLGGATLFRPEAPRTQGGTSFGVYTPFARACRALPEPPAPIPAPTRIPAPPGWPESEPLQPFARPWCAGWAEYWPPGEAGARAMLDHFTAQPAAAYAQDRDRPDRHATSHLSPHLRWGEISPATVWHATAGSDKFRAELLWREFAYHLLWHRPQMASQPLRSEFTAFPWRDDPQALAAWQQGRTGVPIVDAGMRELWQTGTMHNRVRMIVGSYLTKHLLLSWQRGQAWFAGTLLDADTASNAMNWQWVAGCGVDAQPYFRIFNPVLQGLKFDPEGTYVQRFVPELRGLPAALIHQPWELQGLERAALRYPAPLIGLRQGRDRALAAYEAIK